MAERSDEVIPAPSPEERRHAVVFLGMFLKKTAMKGQELEKAIFRADMRLGMRISRQSVRHWIVRESVPSPYQYESLLAFMRSKVFLKEVPEAEAFVSGALAETIALGRALAKLQCVYQCSREIAWSGVDHLIKLDGTWSSFETLSQLGGNDGAIVFRIQHVPGENFSVIHSINHIAPYEIRSGFIYGQALDCFRFSFYMWDRTSKQHTHGELLFICPDLLELVEWTFACGGQTPRQREWALESGSQVEVFRNTFRDVGDVSVEPKTENEGSSIGSGKNILDNILWSVIGDGTTTKKRS